MSATLEVDAIISRFGAMPVLRVPGRTYPVELQYLSVREGKDPLNRKILRSLQENYRKAGRGSTLVFLPGVGEINRAIGDCGAWAKENGILLFPLHGNLSSNEQRKAVKENRSLRVVFATNVAETSLTVEHGTHATPQNVNRDAYNNSSEKGYNSCF